VGARADKLRVVTLRGRFTLSTVKFRKIDHGVTEDTEGEKEKRTK
jgi:hypothetical protein